MTQLVDALRARFKDGRSALRALGLDESLLDSEDTLLRKNADKVINQLLKRFGTTQKVPQKLGMDQSMLTEPEHMRSDPRGGTGGEIEGGVSRRGEDKFGLLSSSRDHIPPKIETNEEDLSRDEDLSEEEERSLAEHAAQMRERGEDDLVIDHAMRMARDVLRRQRGHADDRRMTKDRFPQRAHHDPSMDRGHEAHDNFGAVDPANPEGRFLVDHGLDAMDSGRAAIRYARQRMRNIGPEVGCNPERFRGATDSKPLSAKQTAELYGLFPDMARIGTPSEDGVSIRNGTYKSRYEV